MGCWQDSCSSLVRATGEWGRVLCLCSAPSREFGLGNTVWKCSGLRHCKMKSRGFEQSWHEHRTEIPSYKDACILYSAASQPELKLSMTPLMVREMISIRSAFGRLSASLPATETSSACSHGSGCPADSAGYLKPTSINFCLEQGLMNWQPAAITAPSLHGKGAMGCVWRQKMSPFPNLWGEICLILVNVYSNVWKSHHLLLSE